MGRRSNYFIGYYFERKAKEELKEQDYLAWRTPASKSAIDVVAINPKTGEILLVQVKRNPDMSKIRETIQQLRELKKEIEAKNIKLQLWIYRGKNRKEIITIQ